MLYVKAYGSCLYIDVLWIIVFVGMFSGRVALSCILLDSRISISFWVFRGGVGCVFVGCQPLVMSVWIANSYQGRFGLN